MRTYENIYTQSGVNDNNIQNTIFHLDQPVTS